MSSDVPSPGWLDQGVSTHPATFLADAGRLLPHLQDLRRRLHAVPEVGLNLPQTQATVLGELEGLPLEVTTGRKLSSVTAVLRGGKPGPVVLLRGDMDALPVVEATGLDYASTNGSMHACGHDLHVTGLIGAAKLLATLRDELPGTVIFMFQPGEEGHGGGELMIEEGVLDVTGQRPVAAYAIHVESTTPRGRFVSRRGPIMAGVNAMRITVTGTGGHAASPHTAADPVPVSAEIILAVQSFAARRLRATDPAVLSIGRLASDSAASNVLARQVEMHLNIRYLSAETMRLIEEELPVMIRSIAEAHRCTAEVALIPNYPATINDPEETDRALDLIAGRFGADRAEVLADPVMASEDFSYVLQQVPGVFIFLGARPPEIPDGEASGLHAESVVFDDSVLADQAAALAELAWTRLSAPSAGPHPSAHASSPVS